MSHKKYSRVRGMGHKNYLQHARLTRHVENVAVASLKLMTPPRVLPGYSKTCINPYIPPYNFPFNLSFPLSLLTSLQTKLDLCLSESGSLQTSSNG